MEAEKEIKEFGETCTEVELYFQIDAIGAFIWRMRHDMSHGRIPEKDCEAVLEDVKKMSESQQILVEYVKRFDVPYEMFLYHQSCDILLINCTYLLRQIHLTFQFLLHTR